MGVRADDMALVADLLARILLREENPQAVGAEVASFVRCFPVVSFVDTPSPVGANR